MMIQEGDPFVCVIQLAPIHGFLPTCKYDELGTNWTATSHYVLRASSIHVASR